MAGKTTELRVAMQPGKRRALPNTPEGRLQAGCPTHLSREIHVIASSGV